MAAARRSIEARSKRAQDSARIALYRVSVRNDDSAEIAALRPPPELLRDLAPAFAQHELDRARDMRIIAGKSHDPQQPAAEAAFTVNVADQIVDDDRQPVF